MTFLVIFFGFLGLSWFYWVFYGGLVGFIHQDSPKTSAKHHQNTPRLTQLWIFSGYPIFLTAIPLKKIGKPKKEKKKRSKNVCLFPFSLKKMMSLISFLLVF